jgi:hypothetical protein
MTPPGRAKLYATGLPIPPKILPSGALPGRLIGLDHPIPVQNESRLHLQLFFGADSHFNIVRTRDICGLR